MKKLTALILLLTLMLTSCAASNTVNLMAGIVPNVPASAESTDPTLLNEAMTDFALELFKSCSSDGQNTLISPLSVYMALAMTSNGAVGDTLAEFETVLGSEVSLLNKYLYDYTSRIPQDEKCRLNIANSIWFRDSGFTPVREFLQTNADSYSAGIFKAPFDSSTKRDINRWVSDNTDGMIREILDDIPSTAVMYLVNALAFDAEWHDIYEKHQVRDGIFTTEDGTQRKADMMYSSEYTYLSDGNAEGFMKYYSGHKYAFAALLPNDGMTVAQYIGTLDAKSLRDMLSVPKHTQVNAAIPKFETEYSCELSDVLTSMGMENTFDPLKSDFSGIGQSDMGNIYISRVLHKTCIEVSEKGTRAGAATVIEADSGSTAITEPKEVILDRPFVYMIVDTEAAVPVFIGALMDVK